MEFICPSRPLSVSDSFTISSLSRWFSARSSSSSSYFPLLVLRLVGFRNLQNFERLLGFEFVEAGRAMPLVSGVTSGLAGGDAVDEDSLSPVTNLVAHDGHVAVGWGCAGVWSTESCCMIEEGNVQCGW